MLGFWSLGLLELLALWKTRAHWNLEADWEPLTEDLFSHLKRSALLNYRHSMDVQWDRFNRVTLSSTVFCPVIIHGSPRDCSRSRMAAATVPELEGPKQTIKPHNMTTGRRALPNSGYTAHNPFHHISQLEVQRVWRLNHNLVEQFSDYHWSLQEPLDGQSTTPPSFWSVCFF